MGIKLLGAVTRLGEKVDHLSLAVGDIRKQALVELEQHKGIEAVDDEEVGDAAMSTCVAVYRDVLLGLGDHLLDVL